jgi:alginate O-acetyltransferase complex protein AlgI
VTFITGRLLETSHGKRHKLFLSLGIAANLVPLFILKYLNFFLDTLAPALSTVGILVPQQVSVSIHLPAGISFFTFQAISYLIDVHRRVTPSEPHLLGCGLYISMFPQLIAGPIVRYHDISRQLMHRWVTLEKFSSGAERFIFGLAKKVLLADPLGVRADTLFNLPLQHLSMAESWLGAICFTLQIYYDFSGYSDMAIGLGKIFGFDLPENFNYPYISRSIREFWQRWHISLSTWLRDYLYIPLGGNRKGAVRTLLNLLVVFLLCGLWHGANWTFVCWGLWHGLFLVIERETPLKADTPLRQGLGWAYTTCVVIFGWVLFRSPNLNFAKEFMATMVGMHSVGTTGFFDQLTASSNQLFLTELATGIVLSFPIYANWIRLITKTRQIMQSRVTAPLLAAGCSFSRVALFAGLLYFVLITIASQAYSPFLYFQF